MTTFSSELLRDMSVLAVEDFLNNKVPLSKGIAKQASLYDLNDEQIKRAVESTNTIAYLKVLGMSQDRTVEFPLAKYAEVMQHVSLPDAMKKTAGWEEEKTTSNDHPERTSDIEDETDESGNQDNIEDAEDEKEVKDEEADARKVQEKRAYFLKEAAINRRALEELEVQSDIVKHEMLKQATVVAKDPKGLDKLAAILDEQSYSVMSRLVTGSSTKYNQAFKDSGFFKEAELKQVKGLAELYKQAQGIVRDMVQRGELQKRAELIEGGMKKEAFFNATGKAVGTAIGAPIAAVAKAPFQAAGRVGGNAAGALGAKVTGSAFTPKPAGKLGKALAGGVGVGAVVGLDAAMYDPGTDKNTGHSNDVWSNLQRE